MNKGQRHWRDARGFTLVETVIAFAIVATALSALMQAFSQSVRNADISADQVTALMQARSTLDRLGHDLPLATGQYQGQFDNGFNWTVSVEPYASQGVSDKSSGSGLIPYRVEVSVSRAPNHAVTLTTVRLAAAAP